MGYGRLEPRVDAFLGSIGSPISLVRATRRASGTRGTDLPIPRPTPLHRDYHRPARLPSCVTPVNTLASPVSLRVLPQRLRPEGLPRRVRTLGITGLAGAVLRRYGNINPLSIDYACRPRLRSRLTQGGLAWPWNPWSFGGRVSHPSFATHACILTRVASTAGLHRRFTRHTTLSYRSARLDRPKTAYHYYESHDFGGVLEPRYIVGAESLDQ